MVVGSPIMLNLIPGGVMPVIMINETDKGYQKEFLIYNGNAPYNVPANVSATIRGTKRDGLGVTEAATVTAGSNVVRITVTEQMTAVPGKNIFELVFVDTNSLRVATANFIMLVERSALNANTVISESDIAYADQVLNQLQGVAAFKEQLDNASDDVEDLKNHTDWYVTPEDYGAAGDGTTNDTVALNAAFASGKTVVIAKPYLASNDITIATDVIGTSAGKLILGKNVWIQTAGVNISGVTFDGNNGCGFVRVRADDICINECNFINFADIADYKYCVALIVGESNTHFTGINVTKCFFDGAKTYYDDGTQGNQTGTVRQLLIDRADCNVDHCTFMNLSGYTDGDNIHVRGAEITSGLIYPQSVSGYKADYQKVVITNNLILMSNKSAIKNQCSGTIIKNNTIIVSSSTATAMHSAIRSMASGDVKIIGNLVRHLSGTLTGVYTVEYCNRCIVSENALEGVASTLSYIFRLVDNTEITVSGNNVQTVSSASFEYGCYNSGIVSDNAFDCGVTLDGYVYLFDEERAESSPPTNDQTLIIRGNTFKCSGSLRQFLVLFQYSVDLEIKDNTVIGTFTSSSFCQYRIYFVNNAYSKIRLFREMLDNAVNINISQSSDTRTKQIACTIEDSPVTKINAYNCASLKLKNCAIGKFNSTPIDIYSSAAVDIDGCDCRNITTGFISIHSATPTFELSNNVIKSGFDADKLFVSDNSYNLSGVKWHKNNASSIGNVDYAFSSANIKGFTFDAGAICYNNTGDSAFIYFGGTWHSLAAA